MASKAFGAVAVGIGAATTAVAGLVTASIGAYADYEQLVGGVDTLFKESSKKVQQYADEAYKTAGLSANAYMETVTSFSASLLQSLDGDTNAAADKANQAIIDMSDNANKMGSDMASIQNAYQGFAKQNYTMLDNLKLGYGGTKEEMARLLEDAGKISGIKYDISSYADVVDAIHVMQESMGIAGTTAKEASTTISGSVNSMKSAWSNLLVGIADDNQDFGALIDNFVNSVGTVAENIMPRVETALGGVGKLIENLLPVIADAVPGIINNVLPKLLTSGANIVTTLIGGISKNLPLIVETVLMIGEQLINTLLDIIPQLLEMGLQIIIQLTLGIAKALPKLIPAIVDVLLKIVDILIDNIPLLIDAALQIIVTLAEGLIQALPRLIEKVPEIITGLIDAIVEALPMIIDAGLKLFMSLIEALPVAIEAIVSALPQIIDSIINTLITALPLLIDAGIQLFMALIEALPQIIEAIVAAIPQIIDSIVNALFELIPLLIECGFELFVAIIQNLPGIIVELVKAVPQIINALIGCFNNLMSKFTDVGKNIVTGIWNGIREGWDWLVDSVKDLVNDLFEAAKDALDIHSQSRKFGWLAEMCVAGWGEGTDGLFDVSANVKGLNASLNGLTATASMQGNVTNSSYSQVINVNQPIATPDELARAIRVESRYGLMKGVPIYG